MRVGAAALAAAALALAAPPVRAIETDQYYAWGRPLADATDALNAKVGLELERVLAAVNGKPSWQRLSCDDVRRRVSDHLRQFLIHDVELWANNTSLIERIPADAGEEFQYRKRYLYHDHGFLDPVTMVPPSPTIEVHGVRFGTDKLTHFFSEGWWYHKVYRRARARGRSHAEAERQAINRGLLSERTILGMGASGVLSIADLEANHQGMLFWNAVCGRDDPLLERTPAGWSLRRDFDFRDHVTPEWDESWQTSIVSKRRWRRIRPVLERYCPLLDDPSVRRQREAYRLRDRETPTERRIRELVERGKLADPERFSIERLCGGDSR